MCTCMHHTYVFISSDAVQDKRTSTSPLDIHTIVLDESKSTIDESTSGEHLPNIVQGMCILFQLHKSCHEFNITQIPTAHCLFSNSKALQRAL